jgi:hypothetical protein
MHAGDTLNRAWRGPEKAAAAPRLTSCVPWRADRWSDFFPVEWPPWGARTQWPHPGCPFSGVRLRRMPSDFGRRAERPVAALEGCGVGARECRNRNTASTTSNSRFVWSPSPEPKALLPVVFRAPAQPSALVLVGGTNLKKRFSFSGFWAWHNEFRRWSCEQRFAFSTVFLCTGSFSFFS